MGHLGSLGGTTYVSMSTEKILGDLKWRTQSYRPYIHTYIHMDENKLPDSPKQASDM
jgi:hypothetical protein